MDRVTQTWAQRRHTSGQTGKEQAYQQDAKKKQKKKTCRFGKENIRCVVDGVLLFHAG